MLTHSTAPHETEPRTPTRRVRFGLSGKLLLLTLVFVTAAELAIFVPTMANFRISWLSDRVAAARTAALVLDAAPEETIPPDLTRQLLANVGAQLVVVKAQDTRRLLAMSDMPPTIDQHLDMREITPWHAVWDGLAGALVYISLHLLFVRPMRRLTERMSAYREAPEDASRIITPSGRGDEIGIAEEALAELQRELSHTLTQKSRLAALGLAVSKINHDLRNLLASAQLISDRLVSLPDPAVQRFAPKLVAALDRAIAYCEQTLSYGRAQEPLPDRRDVDLGALFDEVRDMLGLHPGAEGDVDWVVTLDRPLTADADPDQLFRVILNLSRNSLQALEGRKPRPAGRDQIRVAARRHDHRVEIEISDTGPGIPPARRDRLFSAFQASARAGGTGLGLPIAEELVRAHGGEIRLLDRPGGATFLITIPDRAQEARPRGQRLRAG
ncbi:MAG: histidine kinase [Rhizobiales bacterium 32-66-11]|nr:MAG: histidine kinase [Rhizobiales bacterium 32-66-11]